MSLRSLVSFAQEHISRQQLNQHHHTPPPSLPRASEDKANLDSDDEPGITRPEFPDWLRAAENEVIPLDEGTSLAIDDDEQIVATRVGDRLTGQRPNVYAGPDALAYYLPFHFYVDGVWGIYVRVKGIIELACEIKGDTVKRSDSAELKAGQQLLLDHECFHCLIEAAATRAEVVAGQPIYHSYFYDKRGAAHEEAMANAHAFRNLVPSFPSFSASVSYWMSQQGVGYRDFQNFVKGRNFSHGQAKCGGNIIRFVPPKRAIGAYLPSGFLFGKHSPSIIPTYLVVESDVARYVLKPFPKFNGIIVKVHSREHPPPHFHIEMPPGKERTRYVWPTLQPMDGDPKLSHKEEDNLRVYLREFGQEIHRRLVAVYPTQSLAMPSLD